VGELSASWATDVAVLERGGSQVCDRGDHLVLRTPANPGYHWGNFVLVTDPHAIGDADRWVAVFAAEFPRATWLSVGLVARPGDPSAWLRHGVELEDVESLVTDVPPARPDRPRGYAVRPFEADDWERDLARSIADSCAEGDLVSDEQREFLLRQAAQRRQLVGQGVAAWFGAFAGDHLVADLGVVVCGRRARYQDVTTDLAHRRRGLAAHLVGVAGEWARGRGCTEWVIVTETSNDAGRVYRRAGFAPAPGGTTAYRRPG
jgi:GNAT superfamily N-acetyltransferase